MQLKNWKNKNFVILLFICLFITLITYSNTLTHQFVWDDDNIILTRRITDFFSGFKSIFSQNYFLFSKEQSFRPLTTLSYFCDAFFWDMNPMGYHLTNMMLHLLAVALVFYLARNLGFSNQGAFVAAAIFAVHPVQTESVNAISFREELLVVAFYLAAFLFLSRGFIAAGSISYLFALLAKEMALSFPLVFFLYSVNPLKDKTSRAKVPKGPLCSITIITVGYLILRFIIFPCPVKGLLYPAGSLYRNILTTLPVITHYIRLFFFPLGLKAEYSVAHYTSIINTNVIFSIILLILIGVYVIRIRNKDKILFFSWLWIGITVLPVANLFPIPEMAAERYLYLPLIGLALFTGRVFEYLFQRYKATVVIATICLITAFSLLTYKRNYIWENDLILWENSRNGAPLSSRLHHNLGNAYLKSGQIKMARVEYKLTTALNPGNDRAYNNLGVAYALSNKPDIARSFWQKAVKLNPDSKSAIFNLEKYFGEQK